MSEGSEVFEGRVPAMVRVQLGELVAENGREILEDPRRVRAMLADTVSTAVREINLINLALSEGVPARLSAAAGDALRVQTEIENLIRQLERNNALHRDAAEWAVRSCAWTLGLVSAPDELEPQPAPPAPAPPPPPPTTFVPDPVIAGPELDRQVVADPVADTRQQPVSVTSASAVPHSDHVERESIRRTMPPEPRIPRTPKRGVLLAGGAALVVIVVAASLLVVSSQNEGDNFSAAFRQLMSSMPEIAPAAKCHPLDVALQCDLLTVPGSVIYREVQSQSEAEGYAFYGNSLHVAPTEWLTNSGDVGGTFETWADPDPNSRSVHSYLGWTFKVGETFFSGVAETCCDSGKATELTQWWERVRSPV